MKTTIIILITALICVLSASATVINKPLINISNCYNLSVSATLVDGPDTDLSFLNCYKTDTWVWACNCYNTDNQNYTLTMQTDDAILRDPREYQFRVDIRTFSFKKSVVKLNADDWGDYVDIGDEDYTNIGQQTTQEKIVYVEKTCTNNTVYVNNTVFKTNDVVVEDTSRLNEYTTKLDQCTMQLNIKQKEYAEGIAGKDAEIQVALNSKGGWKVTAIIFIIILICNGECKLKIG